MPEYFCDICNYTTSRTFNYNVHLASPKHKQLTGKGSAKRQLDVTTNNSKGARPLSPIQCDFKQTVTSNAKVYTNTDNVSSSKSATFKCDYCGRESGNSSNRSKHMRICKHKDAITAHKDAEEKIKQLEAKLNEKDTALNKEKADKEHLQEKYNEVKEQLKTGTTINMCYVQNNFLDAHNFEDLMEDPLTETEIKHIKDYGPASACFNLIMNRCITNVEEKKRPIHCIDSSRNKYLLKTENKWTVDNNGKAILKGSLPKIEDQCIKTQDELKNATNAEVVKNALTMQDLMELDQKGTSKIIKKLNNKVLLKNIKI